MTILKLLTLFRKTLKVGTYTIEFNRGRGRSDQNFMTLKREKIGLRRGSKNKSCSYIVETILSGENNKEIKEV